jgi:hypothetical protein
MEFCADMPGNSLGSRRRTGSSAVVVYLPGAAETAAVFDTKWKKLHMCLLSEGEFPLHFIRGSVLCCRGALG